MRAASVSFFSTFSACLILAAQATIQTFVNAPLKAGGVWPLKSSATETFVGLTGKQTGHSVPLSDGSGSVVYSDFEVNSQSWDGTPGSTFYTSKSVQVTMPSSMTFCRIALKSVFTKLNKIEFYDKGTLTHAVTYAVLRDAIEKILLEAGEEAENAYGSGIGYEMTLYIVFSEGKSYDQVVFQPRSDMETGEQVFGVLEDTTYTGDVKEIQVPPPASPTTMPNESDVNEAVNNEVDGNEGDDYEGEEYEDEEEEVEE